MESAQRLPRAVPFSRSARFDGAALATWLLGAAVVAYLFLKQGGYDPIVRGEVGVAIWVVAICGIASGAFPLPWATRAGSVLLALLAGYTVWTALSLGWTGSEERTAVELARVCTYLGILVLALCAVGDGRRARHLLAGATTAIGVVCGLAVLSRLHPQWFPENTIGTFLPDIEIERRLNYPLEYSAAVGVMGALAIPLLLGAAATARTLIGQAVAAAAVPLAGFTIVLASSGTGTGAAVVAIAAFIVLSPDRLPKLGTLALGAAGTAILAAALDDRAALDRGLPTPAALDQGSEMIVIALVVCAGIALAQTAIGMAVRYGERPAILRVSRRNALIATAGALVVFAVGAVAAGLPGQASDEWDNFRSRGNAANQSDRGAVLLDTSSSGRYQFWQSAERASETDSLKGIGPGTFEFWWAKDPENFGFTRDAHSLYAENLGELGWIGFILITGLMLAALGVGAWRSFTAAPAARARIACATAGCAVFAAAAAFEFLWEIAALPAIAMLLFAVLATDTGSGPDDVSKILARRVRSSHEKKAPASRARVWGPRIAFVVVAVVAAYWIWTPLRGAEDLRQSQIEVAAGDLPAALDEARSAADAQPDAASPLIQQALVLERQGEYKEAAGFARQAVDAEAVNWRNWATLARLEARAGNDAAAVRAIRQARRLNARTPGAKA